jgi:hypothetical protein
MREDDPGKTDMELGSKERGQVGFGGSQRSYPSCRGLNWDSKPPMKAQIRADEFVMG